MIMDRTETVYGYLKKTEVRAFMDADILSQPQVLDKEDKGKQGIINDPDGYVNIRKEMNAQSEVAGKIVKGEVILYWDVPDSNWCIVQTGSGVCGFVYKNRIREKIDAGKWILDE
jgi:hypothetical protein